MTLLGLSTWFALMLLYVRQLSLGFIMRMLWLCNAVTPVRAVGVPYTLPPTVGVTMMGCGAVSSAAETRLLVTLPVTPVTTPVAVGVMIIRLGLRVSETRRTGLDGLLNSLIVIGLPASVWKASGFINLAVRLSTMIPICVLCPRSRCMTPYDPQVVTLLATFSRTAPFLSRTEPPDVVATVRSFRLGVLGGGGSMDSVQLCHCCGRGCLRMTFVVWRGRLRGRRFGRL